MSEPGDLRQRKFGPYIAGDLMNLGVKSALYTAQHEATGQQVALRVLAITARDTNNVIEQCADVLSQVRQIEAPHLVPVLDYGTEGTLVYIAMELMEHHTLYERMVQRHFGNETHKAPQRPAPAEVLAIVQRMAVVLDAIHQSGWVHGQLDPRSIFFNAEGEAFLADIGLSRLTKILYKLDDSNSFNINKYSPPEVWEGKRIVSASDQYALACIAYELLTGQAPFESSSVFKLMEAHRNDVVQPPHVLHDDLPGKLALVFWQALAKPPERRFASVTAFAQALAQALHGHEGASTGFLRMA